MSACCATGQNSQQLFEVVWSGQDVRSMRVIHLLTTQSIIMDKNNHEFMHSSFIVHSRRIMSCHVQFSLVSVNNQFAPCNNRHYAQCQPSRPRNLGPFFAGRDAVASMQRLLKRTGFWSASIVRLDLLQAPMPAAGGKTAANQVDRANAVPKLRGSRVASHACWAFAIT